MSDAAEARRKRMEKIKARANNQEVLTQSLLSGNISQYKAEPEPAKTELQNLDLSQNTPLVNREIPSDSQQLISPPQVTSQTTEPKAREEPEMDAFEKYRKIKALEQQRRQYLRTKSVALMLLALSSAIWLSYTGHKDHHNFFFTFLLFDIMASLGLSHMFKGNQVYSKIADEDGMGELNSKILTYAESAMQKARFAFEVFDDLSVFLVVFVSITGVGQFLGSM
jgi:hypothetical protein